MTVTEFVQTIDGTTPEKILVQANTEELKSEGKKIRVSVQLWQILHGEKVDVVTTTEFSMMLTLTNGGKVYLLDFCKYEVTLAEIIPPEPLDLPN